MQTPEHLEEQSRDQQARVRMEDEGCPNGHTARLPPVAGFSRNVEKHQMPIRLKTKHYWLRKVSMTISSVDALSNFLRPLCSRDNHVMKYESRGSWSNADNNASYHCGFEGCSVRYDATDGYYMLIGMPNHANPVDEPGVNTVKCPKHDQWLYRRENVNAKPGAGWGSGVTGCDYDYSATDKGDWVRT